MILNLTREEQLQFSQILPGQGSLEQLRLIRSILTKTALSDADIADIDNTEIRSFEFSEEEFEFVLLQIQIRDNMRQLPYSSLDLILKIEEAEQILKEAQNGKA